MVNGTTDEESTGANGFTAEYSTPRHDAAINSAPKECAEASSARDKESTGGRDAIIGAMAKESAKVDGDMAKVSIEADRATVEESAKDNGATATVSAEADGAMAKGSVNNGCGGKSNETKDEE